MRLRSKGRKVGRSRFAVCARVACALLGIAGCAQAEREQAEREQSGQAEAALAAEDAGDWQRELGSAERAVSSSGVVADAAGNAIVTGYTLGSVVAARSSCNAFVAKYSPAGELLWSRELGTSDSDASAGVSADAAGNVFIAGDTQGALEGAAVGFGDAFVAKYSVAGELDWARQLGTQQPDAAVGVSSAANGDALVTGFTRGALQEARAARDADVWVARYSAAGELLWIRQLGSSAGYDDLPAGVSVDPGGDVFVAGHTFGALGADNAGSADAFVAKLSAAGDVLWLQQSGHAGYDDAEAVSAAGDGNVYVAGQRGGVLAGGPSVVLPGTPYVAKYSPSGELLWELPFDGAAMGSVSSSSTDPESRALVAGYTSSDWAGTQRGLYDSFVAQLSPAGELLWAVQEGTEQLDQATGISADGTSHVFFSQDVRNRGEQGSDAAFLSRRALSPLRN